MSLPREIAGCIIAAAVLGCCVSAAAGEPLPPATDSANTAAPITLGLTRMPLPPGVTSFQTTLSWDHHTRSIVYLRPTADPAGKVPALLMLHYRYGTPAGMADLTDAGKLVQQYGIWVILPQGLYNNWGFDPRRDWIQTDDSGFLAQLIDVSVADYPLDPSRVYVTGFSEGGFMAERFVCDHADKVAAASWVAATLLNSLRDVCAPVRPVPVLGINGTADGHVRYDGKTGVASAPATMAFYAGLNRCATPPAGSDLVPTVNDGTSVHLDAYANCASAKTVDFYTINGGGHTWPDSTHNPALLGRTSHNIDGTAAVWNFMQQFTLP